VLKKERNLLHTVEKKQKKISKLFKDTQIKIAHRMQEHSKNTNQKQTSVTLCSAEWMPSY
jgi:hypothetical protein